MTESINDYHRTFSRVENVKIASTIHTENSHYPYLTHRAKINTCIASIFIALSVFRVQIIFEITFHFGIFTLYFLRRFFQSSHGTISFINNIVLYSIIVQYST